MVDGAWSDGGNGYDSFLGTRVEEAGKPVTIREVLEHVRDKSDVKGKIKEPGTSPDKESG
jgi:hypothetical protein